VLNSYFAEFEALEPSEGRLHEHKGTELIYVISGTLELRTAEERHELAAGDAIYFDSSVPHGYRRMGSKPTTALVVSLDG
jgi:quercetin dioxygenase-like cupin family protein